MSPIIIDVSGEGFHLSDAIDGVWFKVFPTQRREYQVAWPLKESRNGWLVLDRNGNGVIDDFSEFFGDLTPQPNPPPGQQRNGFLALRVFDTPEYGGNDDGMISAQDAIYNKLRVWIDDNHDGVSQPEELHTLTSLGIAAISLNYTLSSQIDSNGNIFRYRSKIRDSAGGDSAQIIYDVYLMFGSIREDPSQNSWLTKLPGVKFQ